MLTTVSAAAAQTGGRIVAKGRLKQSVCRWCYAKIPDCRNSSRPWPTWASPPSIC